MAHDRLPNAIARLRQRRVEIGMVQKQLADAIGVTVQQCQKYERAINRISAGILYELALTLGVSVQYFSRD